MAKVIALHVWMQNKRETWTEPEVTNRFGRVQRGRRVILDVDEGTTIPEMKIAVAEELKKHIRDLKYYYVVVQVQRDDGDYGFRTIVPMTIIDSKTRQRLLA
jgi:hypothetical protein